MNGEQESTQSLIFLNANTISLSENEIILWDEANNIEIPINKIYRISGHSSFVNQSVNPTDFYKIKLTKKSNFDKTTFYKTNNEAPNDFAN